MGRSTQNSYKKRYLAIPDLQIPFENLESLDFIKRVAKHFRIPKENMLNLGDEVDFYNLSSYFKDPDALHTVNQEFDEVIEKLHHWYNAFPYMRVCNSNHQARFWKKAVDAQIPSRMLRKYREIIEAPKGWRWAEHWQIKTKHPFMIEHGCGYSGVNAHRNAAIDNTISTIIGHLHSKAGISYIKTKGANLWAVNSGALIDEEAYAFAYSKHARHKSVNGCTVVLDDGHMPVFVPLGSL